MFDFTRNVKNYTCCYERTAVVLFAFVSIVLLFRVSFNYYFYNCCHKKYSFIIF